MSLASSSNLRALVPSLALTDRAIVLVVSAVFVLPSALFALAMRPLPALCVAGGCTAALALIATVRPNASCGQLAQPVRWMRLIGACAFAAILLLLGGETHLFYPTSDWLTRDAVLADLIAHGTRVGYRIGDTDYLLRAPLGLYMVPALVGRAFGSLAAHVALLMQNSVILGATFYLLSQMGRGSIHLLILVLFAGVSIVGLIIRHAYGATDGALPYWLLVGLDSWHPLGAVFRNARAAVLGAKPCAARLVVGGADASAGSRRGRYGDARRLGRGCPLVVAARRHSRCALAAVSRSPRTARDDTRYARVAGRGGSGRLPADPGLPGPRVGLDRELEQRSIRTASRCSTSSSSSCSCPCWRILR